MTYLEGNDGGRSREGDGDYVKLRWGTQDSQSEVALPSPPPRGAAKLWFWVKLVASFLCLGLFAFIVFQWVGPFFIEKVIIPITNWERNRFSPSELAVLLFGSIALFPTLLLPSSPSMWMAGMLFGYVLGFMLIISAAAVGVSLPFFIGSIFHRKIEGWLEKYPKKASVLRFAGEGNWFHQFQAITLIRISPFPYILFNYCAVATTVKYGPYLCGSLVGMVPEVLVSLYTGILIRTLANASHKEHTISVVQIVLNVVGLCITVATVYFITVYAKRRLKELQKGDELLLQ